MSIFASIIFGLAAVTAVATIWKTTLTALPSLRALRRALAEEEAGHVIRVTTLNTRTAMPRRSGNKVRRHPQPKPVTHRLHHYPHRTQVA
ncbi:hypothetical protein [Novosphingobium resinovorum]|uniref:hypothetical protein n=1 Tax=Novosphingobium resinovorum TaxID=158500 RepID=UPI002ED4B242|nr:hypothetical protein [Novosphingobium resinovorum]